jgi:hypothetical protein
MRYGFSPTTNDTLWTINQLINRMSLIDSPC